MHTARMLMEPMKVVKIGDTREVARSHRTLQFGNFILGETPSKGVNGSDFCPQRTALTATHRTSCLKVSPRG